MFLTYDEQGITGYFAKELFDAMPAGFRRDFEHSVTDLRQEGADLTFNIPDDETAERLYSWFRKIEKQRNRDERRRVALRISSGGVYTASDLRALWDAQEGRCYFTGEELCLRPKNYSLDHLSPIAVGGTCWPGNLAFVLRSVNEKKHDRTAKAFWLQLKRAYGAIWVAERRIICHQIDLRRRSIDRARKKLTEKMVMEMQDNLRNLYPAATIDYELVDDTINLIVNDHRVEFALGFIRQRTKVASTDYIGRIVEALLGRQ